MPLIPDHYYDSVFQIPYQELLQKNIRGLIFDIDNTLTPFDKDLPPTKIVALINRLQNLGFKICLLTNNTNNRLKRFNIHLKLDGYANAAKPLTSGVKKCMKTMETSPGTTAIIGDQLLSDIWAGKNAGITTILVKPITDRDFWFVHVKRRMERFLLRNYFKTLNR